MRAQVWLETVIYTLVGLGLIALVLAIVTPSLNEYRDRAVIEQSIEALHEIDSVMSAIRDSPGNVRIVEFQLKRGLFEIDANTETLRFTLPDSRVIYTEPDVEVTNGRISILTTEGSRNHEVRLSLSYEGQADILADELDGVITFNPAATSYQFRFEHEGFTQGNPFPMIRITEVSGR